MNSKQIQKEINQIEFVLRQYKDNVGKFGNPSFTIGYIISKIERINNTEI